MLFGDTVQWQFRMSWALARDVHLSRITDEICFWTPHDNTMTVHAQSDGTWRADWAEPVEGEPWSTSVAWLTWHLQLWLTQALAEIASTDVPSAADVGWPGTASGAVIQLDRLAAAWMETLQHVKACDMNRPTTFPWPDPRPLHRLVSWANMEMMKNAAEIGAAVNAAIFSLRQSQQ